MTNPRSSQGAAAQISLLIPCFNAASYLPRLMESVRAQTVPFAEIVGYNDGSSDETAEVARKLGLKLITSPQNLGASHARNVLWRASQCDWVHFHDADDLLHPEFVAQMSARLDGLADVVICSADWRFEDTRELELRWSYSESELQQHPVAYLLQHPVGGINGVYRKACLETIGGFSERLQVWEDADLHVRLAAAGARFGVIAAPLVTALRRRDSVSAPMLRNWQNRLVALRDYAATLPADCVPALVAELETTARSLLKFGDPSGTRSAFRLAHSLGGDLPSTGHPLLKLCKRTFGRMIALRLQMLVRRR